jgi:hypothetical protein
MKGGGEMKIGFTGSRNGMSHEQRVSLRAILTFVQHLLSSPDGAIEFHHGDCVGADSGAHDIAMEAGCYIVIHPPSNDKLRAYCEGHTGWCTTKPAQDYIERRNPGAGRGILSGMRGSKANRFSCCKGGGKWTTSSAQVVTKGSIWTGT